MRLTHADRRQAADVLQALLDAVEANELSADTPQERRMLQRIEGALEGEAARPDQSLT